MSFASGVAAVFIFLTSASASPVLPEYGYNIVYSDANEQHVLPARAPTGHIDPPVARSYSFSSNLYWGRGADGQLHQELHESILETVRDGMQQLQRSSKKDCMDTNCNEAASSSRASVEGVVPPALTWRQPAVFVTQPVMLRGSISQDSRGVQVQPASMARGVPDVDLLTIEETQGMQGLGSIAKLFSDVLEGFVEALSPQPELVRLKFEGRDQEEQASVDGVVPQPPSWRKDGTALEQESISEDRMEDEQQQQGEDGDKSEETEEGNVEVEDHTFSPVAKPAYTEVPTAKPEYMFVPTAEPAYTEAPAAKSEYTEVPTAKPTYTEAPTRMPVTEPELYTPVPTAEPAYTEPPRPAYTEPPRPAYTEPPRPAYTEPPRPAYTEQELYTEVPTAEPAWMWLYPPDGTRLYPPGAN